MGRRSHACGSSFGCEPKHTVLLQGHTLAARKPSTSAAAKAAHSSQTRPQEARGAAQPRHERCRFARPASQTGSAGSTSERPAPHRPGAIPATKPYAEARRRGAARCAAGSVRRRCRRVQAIPLPSAPACRPRAWRAALKIGWGPLPAVKYAERAVGSEHQPPTVVQVDGQRSQAGKGPTAVCVRDSHKHASEGEAGQQPPAGCRHACNVSAPDCLCGCTDYEPSWPITCAWRTLQFVTST